MPRKNKQTAEQAIKTQNTENTEQIRLRKFGGTETVLGSNASTDNVSTKSSAQLKQSVDSKAALKQCGSKKKTRRAGAKFAFLKMQISEGNEQIRKELEESIASLQKLKSKTNSLKRTVKRLRAVLNVNKSVKIVDKNDILSRAEAKTNKTVVKSKPKGKHVLQGKSNNNKNVKTELEDEEVEAIINSWL